MGRKMGTSTVYVIIKIVGAPLVGARNDDGVDGPNSQRAGPEPRRVQGKHKARPYIFTFIFLCDMQFPGLKSYFLIF